MGNELEPNRIAEFKTAQAAAPRANADPLPGPLLDAFGQDDIVVNGIKVRKIVAGDWIILKQLNSPVYQMQLGDKPEEVQSTDEENIELIFQFINPIAKVREMLKVSREYFRDEALKALSDQMQPEQIAELVKAVSEQFNRYFSTRLKYIQDQQTDGKETVTNFQEQPVLVKRA